MVSSLLGGFPLKVDAIPDENGFIPDGKGSQITNQSHARLSGTYGLNCNAPSDFLPDAGPASMDAGSSTVDVPDQQTVDPLSISAVNWDSTGVSIQPENPELLRDTGSNPTEPLNNASSTAYDALGATRLACDEDAAVCTNPNTVDPTGYSDVEISQSVPTPRLWHLSGMLTYPQSHHAQTDKIGQGLVREYRERLSMYNMRDNG
jgi:hypothetical protein